MADLALLTGRGGDHALGEVLPALDLLPHRVRVLTPDPAALLRGPDPDLVLVDATADLAGARSTVRTLAAMELSCPVLAVFAEGGLAVLDAQWPLQDLLLHGAGPAEVEARLRLAIARGVAAGAEAGASRERGPLRVADVVVDEDSWIVRAGGEPLDLTFKEFELLRYLLLHAGRVVTREQLLQEVWGVDYYGGTRTVDVHVRRLRAKLGSERESLISTIRHVGYRFAAHPGGENGDVVQ
ncbi:winged helix-turn-helix transcriptional regulator [Ornithinicoccus halotolerans]|uniref:winged helix-turn-helix transcriptional regulator n=1 Tax=Ornithinicoccus halotolerans TaxID=1748220 RepID=UPI0012978A98|nr:winged-helix domain-containing protein [Ornithinicoccus halotolerans]